MSLLNFNSNMVDQLSLSLLLTFRVPFPLMESLFSNNDLYPNI